ncbi:tetratricopeptide repeat protein [Pedobacter frigoris]|uniref:Tetratricopeptide repeat protein n=1 Tax=Pedobacter frigoris TaxID=2571272 RepID=A0A4U1CPN4_9SPHI|nr:tetratricopeptide repeat protein [Pedobacter frigoris]TKC09474.1 tetratricopeptide repeat protein [Pedobacter frigoris]
MKKILLSVLFVGVASLANAQKSEVTAAKNAWGLLGISKAKTLAENLKELNDGLAHTDKAIANEKSKVMAEAWSYRALFSSRISLVDSLDVKNSIANQKIAEEAIAQAKTLDTKGAEKTNIQDAELNVDNAVRNRGIFAYQRKDFATAFDAFKEITKKNPNDTSMYVNTGVVAKEIKNYPEVVSNFKKAIDLGYKDASILYSEIVSITFDKMKDSVAGLTLLQEAGAKFPENPYFIGLETDIYIKRGDIQKSQEMLTKLIQKDPKNATYQYLMGDTYYKQALAVQNQRNALDAKKTKEFNELGVKMTKFIDQSIPYYKAALDIDPKNVSALENLKIIYGFKEDKVNFEATKKKLEEIQK